MRFKIICKFMKFPVRQVSAKEAEVEKMETRMSVEKIT